MDLLFKEICQDETGKELMGHYIKEVGDLVYNEYYAVLTLASVEIAMEYHKKDCPNAYKKVKKLLKKMYKFFEVLRNDTNRHEGAGQSPYNQVL